MFPRIPLFLVFVSGARYALSFSLLLSLSLSPLWLAARPVISTSINVGENSSLSLLHTVDASLFFSFFLFFVTFSSTARKDSAGDGDREIEESREGRESAENKATAVDIWSSYTWSRNFRLIIFIWFLDGVRHTVGVSEEGKRERGGERRRRIGFWGRRWLVDGSRDTREREVQGENPWPPLLRFQLWNSTCAELATGLK